MSIEQAASLVTIVAAVASFASWIFERRKRVSERKDRQRHVWSNISKVRGLMADLEKEVSTDGFDYGKHQAVGKITFMYRDLVNEALSLEENPTISTIKNWRLIGKIGSDWQESCFLNCLNTGDFSEKDLQQLKPSSSDELPAVHTMSAKN